MGLVRIGEAARRLGVAPHVLRHWEDEGVVVPARQGNGFRDYDEETLARARVVQGCQGAGMSLAQVRTVLHRDAAGRDAVVRERRDEVVRQLGELARTRDFLDHVLTCRHPLVSRCAGCAAYAGDA